MVNAPVIKGYEVIKPAKAGGLSQSWVVRQRKTLRMAFLKVYQGDELRHPDARNQFVADLSSITRLSHHGVLRVYEVWQADDACYVTTEYAACPQASETGPLPARQALLIITQVAKTLRRLWRETGLAHGGLNPGNLFIPESGTVKIADFGIVRALGRANRQSGAIIGSPHYMAPEQARGGPVDIRTDIYALGATLVYLLSGHPPFRDSSMEELMQKKWSERGDDIDVTDLAVSPAMKSLIGKMMAHDPNQRHADWDTLIKDLTATQHKATEPTKGPQKIMLAKKPKHTMAVAKPLTAQGSTLAEYRQRSLRAAHSRRDSIIGALFAILLVGIGIYGYYYTTSSPPLVLNQPARTNRDTPIATTLPADLELAVVAPDATAAPTLTAADAAAAEPNTDPVPIAQEAPETPAGPDILANSADLRDRIVWQAGKLNGVPTTIEQGLVRGEYAKLFDAETVVHIRKAEDIIQQIARGQTHIFHINALGKQDMVLKLAVSCDSRRSDDPLPGRCDFENRRMQIWFNNERIWWRWIPAGYTIIEAYIPASLIESADNLLTIENEVEPLCIDAVWLERPGAGPRLVAALQEGQLSSEEDAQFASVCAISLPAPSTDTDRTLTIKAARQLQSDIDSLTAVKPPRTVDEAIGNASALKATEGMINALWEPAQAVEREWQQAIGNALRRRMLPVVQIDAALQGPSVVWELWAQRFGPFVGQWVLRGTASNLAMAEALLRTRIPDADVVWDLPLNEAIGQGLQPTLFRHCSGYWGNRTDRQAGTLRLTTWAHDPEAQEPFAHWLLLSSPYGDWRGRVVQRKHAAMLSEAMLQWWMSGGSKLIIPGAEPGGIFFPEGAGKPTCTWDAVKLLFKMGDGMGKRTICNVLPSDGAKAWADTYWIASNDRSSRTAKCAIYSSKRDQGRTANIRVPVPWTGRTVCTVSAVQLHDKETDPELLAQNQLILESRGQRENGEETNGYIDFSLTLASINLFEFRPADQPSAPPRKIVLQGTVGRVPPLVSDLFTASESPLSSSLFMHPLRTPLHFVDCLSDSWRHDQSKADATPGRLNAWRLDAPDSTIYAKPVDNVVPWNAQSTRMTSLQPDSNAPAGLQTARLHWDAAKLADAKAVSFWIRAESSGGSEQQSQAGSSPYSTIILGTDSKRQRVRLKRGVWQLLMVRTEYLKNESGTLPKWLTLWRDPSVMGGETFEFNGFLAVSDTPYVTEGYAKFNEDFTELRFLLRGEAGKPGHWHCRLPFPVHIEEMAAINRSTQATAHQAGKEVFPFSFTYHQNAQIIEIASEALPPIDTVPDSPETRTFLNMFPSVERSRSSGLAMLRCKIQK